MFLYHKVVSGLFLMCLAIYWLVKKVVLLPIETLKDPVSLKITAVSVRLLTTVKPPAAVTSKKVQTSNPFASLFASGSVSRDNLASAINERFKALTRCSGDAEPRLGDVIMTLDQLLGVYALRERYSLSSQQCRDVMCVVLILCYTYDVRRRNVIAYAVSEYFKSCTVDAFDLRTFVSELFYLSDDVTTRADIYEFILDHSSHMQFEATASYADGSQAAAASRMTTETVDTSLVNLPMFVPYLDTGRVSTPLGEALAGRETPQIAKLLRRYGATKTPLFRPSLPYEPAEMTESRDDLEWHSSRGWRWQWQEKMYKDCM